MTNNHERLFSDERNPETPIPESHIKREYGQHIADGSIDPTKQTFEQYLRNCMAANGGTLTVYKRSVYTFRIREITTETVEVEGDSLEDAREEVERRYSDGAYDVDHFDGVEFEPCCSQCWKDFEDGEGLREVNEGTEKSMMLCDYCVELMENSGELTRCECCGDVFSPSCLKVNPENGEKEICPDCGGVWCD